MGAAGSLSFKEAQAFELMLQLDTLRGHDSTGALAVGSKGDHQLAKCVGTPWELAQDYSYKGLTYGSNILFMGHNRAATVGKVTRKTAHPFEFDHIIGAHNGTLRSYSELENSNSFGVDSEALYYHLDRNGLDNTLGKFTGAFALTWYDFNDSSINFLRNDERTLFYAYGLESDVMFWASESWMIIVACEKKGIKIGDVQPFPKHHHHKIVLNKDTKLNDPVLNKMRIRNVGSLVKKEPKPAYGRGNWPVSKPKTVYKEPSPTATKAARDLLGQTVEVVLKSVVNQSDSVPHIVCTVIGHPTVTARIYRSNDEAFEEMCSVLGTNYTFKVKRFTSIQGTVYVIPDNRTIEPVLEQLDDIDEDLFEGPNNTLLTKKELETKLGQGCAWCTSPELLENHGDVVWLGDGSYVCSVCKSSEEVQEYIN